MKVTKMAEREKILTDQITHFQEKNVSLLKEIQVLKKNNS